MEQMAFYLDQTRCMACNTCTVACKTWHGVNPGPVRLRTQKTHETDAGIFNFVMSCNHCEKPACVPVCSAGAISKRSDGIVIVDRNKCQELKSCINACPFSAPKIADDRQESVQKDQWVVSHPMQKCNFCFSRIDKGETPICVEACPAFAIEFGTVEELKSRHPEAERLNSASFPYAYTGTNTSTEPSYYIKRKQTSIKIVPLVEK